MDELGGGGRGVNIALYILFVREVNLVLTSFERTPEVHYAWEGGVPSIISGILKGKYHANLLSFQNPKMFVCQ